MSEIKTSHGLSGGLGGHLGSTARIAPVGYAPLSGVSRPPYLRHLILSGPNRDEFIALVAVETTVNYQPVNSYQEHILQGSVAPYELSRTRRHDHEVEPSGHRDDNRLSVWTTWPPALRVTQDRLRIRGVEYAIENASVFHNQYAQRLIVRKIQ